MLNERIELLEAENMKKSRIIIRKDIITNMQRCLNRIDGVERHHNIIISGLPEKEIMMEND